MFRLIKTLLLLLLLLNSAVCRSAFYHIRAHRHIHSAIDDNTDIVVSHGLTTPSPYFMVRWNATFTDFRIRWQELLVVRPQPIPETGLPCCNIHLLPVELRMKYKVAALAYTISAGSSAPHLSNLYVSFKSENCNEAMSALSSAFHSIFNWMSANLLV